MGRWRQETEIYGVQERWIPDFRGEWPADDMATPGIIEGVIPYPCKTCSGELTRRLVHPDTRQLEFEQQLRLRMEASAKAIGKELPPFPPLPSPIVQRIYSTACYRGPHGIEKPQGDRKPSSPTTIGKTLELVPAGRTADWRDG